MGAPVKKEFVMTDKTFLPGYYYLHSGGGIVFKPKAVMTNIEVNEYFNSPFVVKYWTIETKEEHEKMMEEIDKIKRGI
jgi:hypothetical protein